MQILAGNARKVSAARFERINHDDDSKLEAKEVTRVVPKIVKRKWSNSDDESDSETSKYEDDYAYSKKIEDNTSDGHVTAEHEDFHDSAIKN